MKRFSGTIAIFLALVFVGFASAGTPEIVNGVLLVRFQEDVKPELNEDGFINVGDPEIDRIFNRFGAKDSKHIFGGYIPRDEDFRYMTRNDYKIYFPADADMWLIEDEMSQLKGVLEVDLDIVKYTCYIPNDPAFVSQWWLEEIHAEEAWDVTTGDSTIIVAGVDTGVDWNHPDIIANIWVNPGEDIDGDPSAYEEDFPDIPGTFGDWNNVDDDNNGLVDDHIGYDWVDNAFNPAPGEDGHVQDNNPMDFSGHGTGVAGAMAATADNGIGGASVAFDCQIMALRAGYEPAQGQGGIQPSAAAAATVYATDNGASVINMSYGGSHDNFSERNAIEYAWGQGVLLFAAAGNDGNNLVHYPSFYPETISVAAINQNGNRADFSNWGNTVDVAAPGVNCYTPWFNDGYDSWPGTSVASPIAGGVGALVISMFPDHPDGNEHWKEVVINTTSQFDLPPDHPIGTGVVNAYQAVTQFTWPEIVIDEWSISDPDGNGHPDVDEQIEVTFSISNMEGWQDSYFTEGHISFDVEGVQIDNGMVSLGTVAAGEVANNYDNPLTFTVPDGDLNGRFAYLSLTITAEPNTYEIGVSQRVMLGTPEILFVDDDGGEDYDEFLLFDLDNYFYNYVHHDVEELDMVLNADYLSTYEAVMWMTGDEESPLTGPDIEALQGAMENGTNVFIFGQTLDEQLSGTDFYSDYLHAESGIGTPSYGLLPVADAGSLELPWNQILLAGFGGADNYNDPDVINAVNGSFNAYTYQDGASVGGVAYEDDTYKMVYFAFPMEAVSGTSGTTDRHQIVASVLSWFDVVSVEDEMTGSFELPDDFRIESAYPNPFNPSTTLNITVPQSSKIKLNIYDRLGRLVTSLANETVEAGHHSFNWNAGNVSAGIYFAVLEADGRNMITKLAYVK